MWALKCISFSFHIVILNRFKVHKTQLTQPFNSNAFHLQSYDLMTFLVLEDTNIWVIVFAIYNYLLKALSCSSFGLWAMLHFMSSSKGTVREEERKREEELWTVDV